MRDRRLYSLDEWDAVESTGVGSITHKIAWKHVDSFVSGNEILYPDGIAALVAVAIKAAFTSPSN